MDSFRNKLKLPGSSTNFNEQQAKFIQDRISSVEKYFAELCSGFAAYIRKAARLRDKNDELAQLVLCYSDAETVNKSLSHTLANFSTILLSLGDFMDARVQKLDNKVVVELSQYEVICKHAKEEVRHTFISRDKELARKKQLDKIRERNPRNRQQITQAETELVKASAEMSRTIRILEDQTDEFERQKLRNIKTILLDFITTELAFHAKSLELFTKAYQNIDSIDENGDLTEFRKERGKYDLEFRSIIRMPERISRLETIKRMSFDNKQSSYSLPTLAPDPNIPEPPIITSTKPISKSMESMDSYKIPLEQTSSSDDESVPVPAPRRII